MNDYLSEDWLDSWARGVVGEIEEYLAKHAAFEAFQAEAKLPPASPE